MLIQIKNKNGKVLFSYDIAGNNHRLTLIAAMKGNVFFDYADFSNWDLQYFDFTGHRFYECNFSDANLDCALMYGASFIACDFGRASLIGAVIDESRISAKCEFGGAKVRNGAVLNPGCSIIQLPSITPDGVCLVAYDTDKGILLDSGSISRVTPSELEELTLQQIGYTTASPAQKIREEQAFLKIYRAELDLIKAYFEVHGGQK